MAVVRHATRRIHKRASGEADNDYGKLDEETAWWEYEVYRVKLEDVE